MSDWRDHESGRTGLSVSDLGDEESMEVQAVGEPFRRDTSESEDALHVPVRVADAPDHVADMSGDPVDNETEYHIINSSSGFFVALMEAFPDGDDVAGETFEIVAYQPGDQYSRYYEIER